MSTYHKISGPFLREADGSLSNTLAEESFELLADNLWQFTEKLDGTNIRIIWDGYRVSFGGRTDKATLPEELEAYLVERFSGDVNEQKFEQKFGDKSVVFYGEGVGPKIQKFGERYGDKQKFVMFDVKVGNTFLTRESVEELATFFNIETVPVFPLMTLNKAIRIVADELKSALGEWTVEGLVGSPVGGFLTRNSKRVIIKLKTEDLTKFKKEEALRMVEAEIVPTFKNRKREVVGKHSTWFVCDVHNWDFTGEDEDVCPVCLGENNKQDALVKLLESEVADAEHHDFNAVGVLNGLLEKVKGL